MRFARPERRSVAQVRVGPRPDDPSRTPRFSGPEQKVVGTLQGDKAARVPCGLEDPAGVLDAHGVVRGRVQDQQRQAQASDFFL